MAKKIIMLIGPSASGKSTTEKVLFKKGLNKAISCTTRAPRKGEIHGKDYFFLSKEEFLKNDSLIEKVEFAGNFYGVSDEQIPEGETTILVVEPKGAKQILEYYKNSNTKVFVVYFDVSKWTMLQRMLKRGDGYWNAIKRVYSDNIAKNFKKLGLKPDLKIKRKETKTPKEIADYIISFFQNR